MVEAVLLVCGAVAGVVGLWRGYAAARAALAPLIHEGETTRTLVEATQTIHLRGRARLFARRALTSVGWLSVALYGAFLATIGLEVAR